MGLTWDEFLKLATVITNLDYSIDLCVNNEDIEIEELNRRVAAVAKDYLDFFNDLKYMQFIKKVRISFTKILKPFSKLITRINFDYIRIK